MTALIFLNQCLYRGTCDFAEAARALCERMAVGTAYHALQ